jgi:hypothetical protein
MFARRPVARPAEMPVARPVVMPTMVGAERPPARTIVPIMIPTTKIEGRNYSNKDLLFVDLVLFHLNVIIV